MSSRQKVLITGASGFIGGRLLEVLHLTGLYDVRAAVGHWSSCARIGRFPVEIVQVNLLDQAATRDAVGGVQMVVHCAYGGGGVTVNGTRNLLAASIDEEVKRFIHLSTTEVYGQVQGEITEAAPARRSGNAYADSKLDAEEACLEYAGKGLSVVILRPPIVYGPFGRAWTIGVARSLIARKLGVLEKHGEGLCNLLFVDDLVRAVILALRTDPAAGEMFNINGPEITTWNQYFQRFNDALGLPPARSIGAANSSLKTLAVEPVRLAGGYLQKTHPEIIQWLSSLSPALRRAMKKTESVVKSTPSPQELGLYSRRARYDAKKAFRILGYRPIFDVDKGLAISSQWIREQGLCRGFHELHES